MLHNGSQLLQQWQPHSQRVSKLAAQLINAQRAHHVKCAIHIHMDGRREEKSLSRSSEMFMDTPRSQRKGRPLDKNMHNVQSLKKVPF